MFKSLISVPILLSGNIKIQNFISISRIRPEAPGYDTIYIGNVRSARLIPATNTERYSNVQCNLLTSDYSHDIARYYSAFPDSFYEDGLKTPDTYDVIGEVARSNYAQDMQWGCERISQRKNRGCTHMFFAPLWTTGEIPQEFIMEFELRYQGRVTVKQVRIDLKETTDTHYLPKYLARYCEKLDDAVVRLDRDSDCAYVYGLDVVRGTIKKAYDITSRALWNYYMPVNDFDYTLTSVFRNTKCVAKQIIPLAFAFDLSDILTTTERYCRDITVRGYYIRGESYTGMYRFDTEYENYHVRFYDIPEYPLNRTDSEKQLKSLTPQIFYSKNVKYALNNSAAVPQYPRGIFRTGPFDRENFKLYEGDLDDYRETVQEIQPYYCKWKLQGTPDDVPYIININEEYNTLFKRYRYALTEENESKYYTFHSFGRYYNVPAITENKTWLSYDYDTGEVTYVDDPTLMASRYGRRKLLDHYKNFSPFFADVPLYKINGKEADNLQFDENGALSHLEIGPVTEGDSTGQVVVNGILYNISDTGAKNLRVERDIVSVDYLDGAYCAVLKNVRDDAAVNVGMNSNRYVNLYGGNIDDYIGTSETGTVLKVSRNIFTIPYKGNDNAPRTHNSINQPEILCLGVREPRYVIYDISENTELTYPELEKINISTSLTIEHNKVTEYVDDIESNFRSHEDAQTYRVSVRGTSDGAFNPSSYKKDVNPDVTVETSQCVYEATAKKINLYDVAPEGESYEQFIKTAGGTFKIPYKKIPFSTLVHNATFQQNNSTVTRWYRYPTEYVNSIILYFALQLFSDTAKNVKSRVNDYASRFGLDTDDNEYFKAVLYDSVTYTYMVNGKETDKNTVEDDNIAGNVHKIEYNCTCTGKPEYVSFSMWDLVLDVYTCWTNPTNSAGWTFRVQKKPAFYWGFGYKSVNDVLGDAGIVEGQYREVRCDELELSATYNPATNVYEYGAPLSMMYISSEEIVRFYTYVVAKYVPFQQEYIAKTLREDMTQWPYSINGGTLEETHTLIIPVDSFGTTVKTELNVQLDNPFNYNSPINIADTVIAGTDYLLINKEKYAGIYYNYFLKCPDIETPRKLFSDSGDKSMLKYRGYPVGLNQYLSKLNIWKTYAYRVLDTWDIKSTLDEKERLTADAVAEQMKALIEHVYVTGVENANEIFNGYLSTLYSDKEIFPSAADDSNTVKFSPEFHRTRRFVPVNDTYDLARVARSRSGYLYVHAPLLKGKYYSSSYTDDIVFQFKLIYTENKEYRIQYSEADMVDSGAGTNFVHYSRKNTVLEQRLDIDYLEKNKKLYLGDGPVRDVVLSFLDSSNSFSDANSTPLYNMSPSLDLQLFFIDELIPVTDTGIFTMMCMYERGDARFWKVGDFKKDACALLPPLEETDGGNVVMLQNTLKPQYADRGKPYSDTFSSDIMKILQSDITDSQTDYDESTFARIENDLHDLAIKSNVLPYNSGVFTAPRNAFMEESTVRSYSDLPFSENTGAKTSMILREIESDDRGDYADGDLYWIIRAPSVRWGLFTKGDDALLRFNVFITRDSTSLNLIDKTIRHGTLYDVIQKEIDSNPYSFASAVKINMLPYIYSTPWAIKPQQLYMKNDVQTVDDRGVLTLVKTSEPQTSVFHRYFGYATPLLQEIDSELVLRYRIRQEKEQLRTESPVRTTRCAGIYTPDRYEHYIKASSCTETARPLQEYKWYNASKLISCPKEFFVVYGTVQESCLQEAESHAKECFDKYLGRLRYDNPEMRAYLFFNYKVNYIKDFAHTGASGEKSYTLTFKYTLQ